MKQLLTSFLLVTLAATAFAQGWIAWGNQFSTATYIPIYGGDPNNITLVLSGQSPLGKPSGTTIYGGPLLMGTGYTMGFYVNNAGVKDPWASGWKLIDVAGFRTGPDALHLPSGLVTNAGGKSVRLEGHEPGTGIAYQMRVWENLNGTLGSYEEAWAAFGRGVWLQLNCGEVVQVPALGGVDFNGTIFDVPRTDSGWTSFNLMMPIPEPTVQALLLLTGGALVLRRRFR